MKRIVRSKWVSTLAVAIFLPVFIALGYWQLQRAEQKRELQAEYDRRASDAPVRISGKLHLAEDLRFYRVVVDGAYESEFQLLVDNRVHNGIAGFFVVTPLRISNSNVRVLVNRGWLPWGEHREHLPAIDVPAGEQRVTGVATVPTDNRFTLGEVESLRKSQPTLWPYLDFVRYRQSVPFPVQPVIVLLDPHGGVGGYTREWNRLDTGIAVHQGYAFQWFALAAGALVIYILLSRRAKVDRHRAKNGSAFDS